MCWQLRENPEKSSPSGEAEREFWASVKESKTPTEFEAYLKAYPEGVYAVLARFRREKLVGLDDASYASARSAGTAESYGEYLSSYPQGRHVEEAREFKAAKEKEEAEHKAREAAANADDAAFARAQSLGTPAASMTDTCLHTRCRWVVTGQRRCRKR